MAFDKGDNMQINPAFYEELESLQMLQRPAEIIFRNGGGRAVIKAVISELFEREGVSYLRTQAGLVIRLDQLTEVNGMIASNYC